MGTVMHPDVAEILLTEKQIQQRLDALAAEIRLMYTEKELTLIGVLTGTVMFMADLLRRLPGPLRIDYIGVASYHGGTHTTNDLIITKSLRLDVRDRDVLVVDDILDTGHTLVKVREILTPLGARSIRYCVFLEKDVPHCAGARADFVGFHIPDKFVIGYGLDYHERYRNLPYIATLRAEIISAGP